MSSVAQATIAAPVRRSQVRTFLSSETVVTFCPSVSVT